MVLKCKNLKLHIGSCCISNFGTAETSNDAISNGFRCWRYGKSYCQGRTAGYRFRSSRSGCRRWGRRGAGVGADGVGAAAGARRDSTAGACFSGSRLVLGGWADFVV